MKYTDLIIRPASGEDRALIANLIHFERFVHRHLDWRSPLDWLDSTPYYLAERNGQLVSALACPPDPPKIAWLRLFAVAGSVSSADAWRALWEAACAELNNHRKSLRVAVIPLAMWFRSLLQASQFTETDRVVVLIWDGDSPPGMSVNPKITLRPMDPGDLPAVTEVDNKSFNLLWQNSQDGLSAGLRESALASVAVFDEKVIGYQVSTATSNGGHLARLAVLPEFQRQGIGRALVVDTINQFKNIGAQMVTVNTQSDNYSSLRLYQALGFRLTGEEYPVFQFAFQGCDHA